MCVFESGKCGKEGKKIQKIEYPESEKSFLDEVKNIFDSFWRAIIWWKKADKEQRIKALKWECCKGFTKFFVNPFTWNHVSFHLFL